MKKGFWMPRWWVVLPTVLPFAAFFWAQLGLWLHIATTTAPGVPAPHHASWIDVGYALIQRGLWIFLSPGPWLFSLVAGERSLLSPGSFWPSIVGSVLFDSLLIYLLLVGSRWGDPKWRVKT